MAGRFDVAPLSGEIMTGAVPGRRSRFAGGAVDAAAGQGLDQANRSDAEASSSRGMSLLNKPFAEPESGRRAGAMFWLTGVGLAACAFWISGGHALMPLPAEAGVFSSSVRIVSLATRILPKGDRQIVLVDAELRNDGDAAIEAPPLDIAVTAGDGRVTRYRLGVGEDTIAPGATYAFSSRLEAPKTGAKAVAVTVGRDRNGE